MSSFFGWGVYLTGQDSEDLSAYERIGARKTLGGAQTLAAKAVNRKIYGWYKTAGKDEYTQRVDRHPEGEIGIRLVKGWYS